MKQLPLILQIVCLLSFISTTAAPGLAGECLVYVGTYTGEGSEGIYAYRFDPATGMASSAGLAAATENPTFLAADPDGRFLYAVNEVDSFGEEPTGAVSVFAIDRESGRLKPLQQVSSLGGGPAHVSLDRSGRYLLVANYQGGSVAVFPIGGDGRLGPHSAFVQNAGASVDPERQAGPHAHSIQVTPDNRFALVADLGLDKLFVYRFDASTGALQPGVPAFMEAEPGAGPRHVAFAPSGKFGYVVNELASTVMAFACEPGSGTLHMIQTVTTLPGNAARGNTAAEILVDAEGRFLYVSNRGDDSLAVFGIHPDDGKVRPLEWVPSGGRTPRNFVLDPTGTWLFAANQGSDRINLFRVERTNGRLLATERSLKVVAPVCVLFVPLRQAAGLIEED